MYEMLAIGQPTTIANGLSEGCYFESTASGLICIYNFIMPSQKEIDAFKSGSAGEVRFIRLDGVLFFLSKLGSLNWVESPYAAQLSPSMSFPAVESGKGYTMTFILVDALTSIVKGIRYVSLGNKFSEELYKEVMSDIDKPIIKHIYDTKIQKIYNRYSTNDLVKFSNNRYKIGTEA